MSEAATTKKAVTKTKKNEVQTIGLASKFAQDAGMGMENIKSEDLVIPRIKLCQSGSPQIKKSHELYIPGLEVGDVFNSLTGQVWSIDEGFFCSTMCISFHTYRVAPNRNQKRHRG